MLIDILFLLVSGVIGACKKKQYKIMMTPSQLNPYVWTSSSTGIIGRELKKSPLIFYNYEVATCMPNHQRSIHYCFII